MRLLRMDHAAIQLPDVPAAVQWYTHVLGLRQVHQAHWGNHPAMMVGLTGTGIALFPAGTVEPHLALATDADGFAEAKHELRDRDIPYEYEDHGPTHSIYFRDPWGTRLEITTPKEVRSS